MVSRGRAFCPGHITGFFHVCEDEDPLRMGSRGAGICLTRGVLTEVDVSASSRMEFEVLINGRPQEDEVTRRVVELLLDEPTRVLVRSEVQLPISQGFGMSGAAALSTAYALSEALGTWTRDELIAAAHRAEVECRTGLGDVYPQSVGGMDLRERPGAPPHGIVHAERLDADVVLCVLGPPLNTKVILSNESVLRSVNAIGRRFVDLFIRSKDLETFFRLSYLFARQTVLAGTEVQAAILTAELYGKASMAMLGNSVFSIGDTERLEEALRAHGEVIRTAVDNEGARPL